MRFRRVDGLGLATTRHKCQLLLEMKLGDLPIVLTNGVIDHRGVLWFTTDDVAGVAMAAAHLAGPHELSSRTGRLKGFLLSTEAAGLSLDTEIIGFGKSFSRAAGIGCCRELLARRNRCTAIVAGIDMLAIGPFLGH